MHKYFNIVKLRARVMLFGFSFSLKIMINIGNNNMYLHCVVIMYIQAGMGKKIASLDVFKIQNTLSLRKKYKILFIFKLDNLCFFFLQTLYKL